MSSSGVDTSKSARRLPGREDRPERARVAGVERSDRLFDPRVLGPEVAHAAQGRLVARAAQPSLELVAAGRVARVGQAPAHAGVNDDQAERRGQRHVPVDERPAVEQQRVPRLGEQRDRLIHDPARQAHRPLLGPPACLGEVERREHQAGGIAEG
jgi:hypothetical protein